MRAGCVIVPRELSDDLGSHLDMEVSKHVVVDGRDACSVTSYGDRQPPDTSDGLRPHGLACWIRLGVHHP